MKRLIFAIAVFALTGLYLQMTAATELRVVALTLAGLVVIALALVLALLTWFAVEKLKLLRAGRIEAEKSAHVLVVTDNGETWVRDTNSRATWRNLTGTPALYVNGKQAQASDYELELFKYRLALQNAPRTITQQAQATALLSEPEPLDLLTVFTQPTQSYAIIGGQQTGKTFQARHIADYWLKSGRQPIVIGPKWDRNEWAGCILFGGNGDFSAVGRGITIIRQIVEKRHADSTKSHKEHKILPVFFDDWTPIVEAVGNARQLVLEATTLYASVNIILYFILHSDTANAWGVDRKGAALKDNFVKLFIIPSYDVNGLIVRDRTRAYLRFAGENEDRPVKLFNRPVLPFIGSQLQIIEGEFLDLEPKPDATETKIIELHRAGESVSNIAAAVFGSKGGPQNERVKTILSKYTGV